MRAVNGVALGKTWGAWMRGAMVCGLALFGALLALPGAAKDKDQDNAREERRHRLQREIHELQRRVDLLNQEDRQLHSLADKYKKQVPELRERISKQSHENSTVEDAADKAKAKEAELQKNLTIAGTKLTEATKQAVAAAPADSTFGAAQKKYLDLKAQYDAAIDQIEESAEYKAAYEEAKTSPDRISRLPAVRKKFINENPKIVELQSALGPVRTAYEEAKDSLVKTSPECRRLNDEVTSLRAGLDKAKDERAKAVAKLNTANRTLSALKSDLARAEADQGRAEHRLKAIPQQRARLLRDLDRSKWALRHT